MKTIKIISTLILSLLLSSMVISCKPEKGDTGPAGQDGKDGNANAKTYVYNNPQWESTGSGMYIDMAGILTDDVINKDAILVYIQHTYGSLVEINIIPGMVWRGFYRQYAVFLKNSTSSHPENLDIVSLEKDGSFTPNANLWPVDWVKVVIIESNNTTTQNRMAMTPTEKVLEQLTNANIDVNDYQAVCEYYGITPQ